MRGRGAKDNNPPFLIPLVVGDDVLEKVDEFVYLGSLVTANNGTSKQIQTRIQPGNRAYFVSEKVRRSTLIRSVIL